MKKSILKVISMLCVFAFVLTGCGNKETTEGTDGTTTEAVTTEANSSSKEEGKVEGEISFSTWGSEQEIEMNKKLIKDFESKNPGTKVELAVINDDYSTTIETRFLGGQAPDVIYGHPMTFLPWIQQGMLMDITDVFEAHPEWYDEDGYISSLYDRYIVDGKNYATVNGADIFVVYYNKSLIEEKGLEVPTENSSWEDLIKLAEGLTEYNSDGTLKTIGMAADESGARSLNAYIIANGGSMFDDMDNPTKVTFESPETLEILENYMEKVDKHVVPLGSDYDFLTGGFAAGQVGMFVSGVYDIVYLSEIEDFDWDITLLPQNENSMTATLYAGYSVNANTKNPELAKAFAAYMMTPDAQKILSETGLITVAHKPTAKSDEVLKFPGAPDNHEIRVTGLENAVNIDAQLISWPEMTGTVIEPAIQKMVMHELTPEEAMKEIQVGLEKLLEEELSSK